MTDMGTASPKTKAADKRSVQARWGKINTDAGWTAIPTVLFHRQRALGLDSIDMNILLHLLGSWWEADRYPFMGVDRIAAALDVTPRTVQRHLKELEQGGLIKRVPQFKQGRQLTNEYDLAGLVKACKPFSQEALDEREQRRREAVARSTRKRPKEKGLTVIPGGKS